MPEHLVVQWGRLGDLVQTRVVLHRMKRDNPTCRIVLSCDARYHDLTKLFPEVDEVWPMELQSLFTASHSSLKASQLVETFSTEFKAFQNRSFETVCNLSPSRAAAVFARAIYAGERLGYDLKDQSLAVPLEISALHRDTRNGKPTPVHLCDVWTKLAKLDNYTVLPSILTILRGKSGDHIERIAVIADAGDPARQAPMEWLTLLIEKLGESNAEILVTGLKSDLDDSISALSRKHPRINDFRGGTNLSELIELLESSDIVIGPDTGALHLASAFGKKCVGLYSGTALAVQTGPYSLTATVLQHPNWDERTAETIQKIIRNKFTESEQIWRPTLDDFGLLYKSAVKDMEANQLISNARQDFLGERDDFEVIIPEFGGRQYTTDLLADLSESGLPKRMRVTLVTSGTNRHIPLPVFENLEIRIIVSNSPLSFAEACNLGAAQSSAAWLLFLNNDTRIEKNSLKQLWLSRDTKIISAPLLFYADGLLQNAGVTFDGTEITELSHGKLELNRSDPGINAVSGVAMLISRARFEGLAGFDTKFRNGYEDIDLCLRANAQGMSCEIITESRITHFRGSSSGRFEDEAANLELFNSRYGNSSLRTRSPKITRTPSQVTTLFLSEESPQSAGPLTRWIWPLENLGFQQGRDFDWVSAAEVESVNDSDLISKVERIVVYRPLNNSQLQNRLLNACKSKRVPIIVDCDDKILDRFPPNSVRGRTRALWENDFRELVLNADRVTASSDELRNELSMLNPNTVLLKTVPHPQWMSGALSERSTGEFKIGFFGTPAHHVDLGHILPAMEKILERYSHVRFYWWGCRPGELINHPQVRQGGPVVNEYDIHLSRIRSFGLNAVVVPLLDAVANRCKTAIKFIEFGCSGIPGVYSDMPVYSDVIRNGVDGLLAQNTTSDWVGAMSAIIEDSAFADQLRSEAYRRQMEWSKDVLRLNTYWHLFRQPDTLNSKHSAVHHELIAT